jgi:hypothetical protein
MTRAWEADPSASFLRRLGSFGGDPRTGRFGSCPDIWELDNGDIAVIGRDLTESYTSRLPGDVSVAKDERLVIIPRETLISAKVDIPDA